MKNICYTVNPNKPLASYICETTHRDYAIKCEELLDRFDGLRVYESRCHRDKKRYPYTCWYVSFKNIEEEEICFILHFEIRNSDISICFRFIDYAPQEVKDNGVWWIRGKSKYLHFRDYEDKKNELVKLINEYLHRIEPIYDTLNCKRRKPCE